MQTQNAEGALSSLHSAQTEDLRFLILERRETRVGEDRAGWSRRHPRALTALLSQAKTPWATPATQEEPPVTARHTWAGIT